MNLNHIRSRLESVRGNGSSFTARCPAHDDKTPSLSVTDKGDRIVLHCHAGCETSAVLTAIGLSWADTFEDSMPGRIIPSLRISERRKLARDYDIEFTIIDIGRREKLTNPKDVARYRKALAKVAMLARLYGSDELEQITAHWRDRDFKPRAFYPTDETLARVVEENACAD